MFIYKATRGSSKSRRNNQTRSAVRTGLHTAPADNGIHYQPYSRRYFLLPTLIYDYFEPPDLTPAIPLKHTREYKRARALFQKLETLISDRNLILPPPPLPLPLQFTNICIKKFNIASIHLFELIIICEWCKCYAHLYHSIRSKT